MSKKNKGLYAKIATHVNNFDGFTLQRGHIYGTDRQNNFRFVTALQPGKHPGTFKFYIGQLRPNRITIWEEKEISTICDLALVCAAQREKRTEIGIYSVEAPSIAQQLAHAKNIRKQFYKMTNWSRLENKIVYTR